MIIKAYPPYDQINVQAFFMIVRFVSKGQIKVVWRMLIKMIKALGRWIVKTASRLVTVTINFLRNILSKPWKAFVSLWQCPTTQKLLNSDQEQKIKMHFTGARVPFLLNQVLRRCVSLLSLYKDYTLKLRCHSARIVLLWMTFLFDVGGSNLFFYSLSFPLARFSASAFLLSQRRAVRWAPTRLGLLAPLAAYTSKGACGWRCRGSDILMRWHFIMPPPLPATAFNADNLIIAPFSELIKRLSS